MNPWISPNGEDKVRPGVINTYGAVIFRVPLTYESFNLRTTFNFGSSTLLINLYGAPRGSTGFYGAFYPLGIEWKASTSYYFILNPMGYAVHIPQLEGVPLTYSQYRASIAFEWLFELQSEG